MNKEIIYAWIWKAYIISCKNKHFVSQLVLVSNPQVFQDETLSMALEKVSQTQGHANAVNMESTFDQKKDLVSNERHMTKYNYLGLVLFS